MDKYTHGGNVYRPRIDGQPWLDFSANINPLGLSAAVREAIRRNIDGLVHYPDPSGRKLKMSLAEFYNVPEENIVLGNGAAELLYVFFQAVSPRRVLIPAPTFSEYERAAIAAGAIVSYDILSAEDDFQPDLTGLVDKLKETDCLVLCNPNNPTGNLLNADELTELLAAAEGQDVWLLVDESFLDFRSDEQDFTIRQLAAKSRRLFVLRSLTKFFAIPGLRLGFGLTASDTVQLLERHKDVWSVNSLSQAAGIAALGDDGYHKDTQELVSRERDYLAKMLAAFAGVRVFSPTVNFILFDVAAAGLQSADLLKAVERHYILLRDCSNYVGLGRTYVRTAVRKREDNDKLLNALNEVLVNASGR